MTLETEFTCPECGKVCGTNAALGSHMRTHGSEPPQKDPKLFVVPWRRMERFPMYAKRAVNMIYPRCESCQEENRPRWWDTCLKRGHNPYFAQIPVAEPIPVVKCDVCGEEVPPDTITHCGQNSFERTSIRDRTRWEVRPNIRQVSLDTSENSGRSHIHARDNKGWRFPEELGIAPMCEMSRCSAPLKDENGKWLKGVVRANWGDYCSPQEARLVALANSEEAIEVFDQRKIRQQLQAIDL